MQTEQTKILGMRIRNLRKNKGMTQFQLAEMVGKTKTTIVNWERGYFHILARDMPKIAESLGCSVAELYQ